MALRNFSNNASATTLNVGITSSDSSLVVDDATGYPSAPFVIVVSAGTSSEEAILVGAKSSTTFSSLTRAFDSTTATSHSAGSSIKHVAIADDFRQIWTHDHDTADGHTAVDVTDATGTLARNRGGTGITASGSAGQVLKMNAAANALEYGNVEAVLNIDGMTDGSGITIADGDDFAISDDGTEKKVNASQLKTYIGTPLVLIDEDNMSTNSATRPPSQQSVKAYVDGQVATEDTLAELNDTTISSPADGALLFYDTATSKWIDNVVSGDATMTDAGALTIAANAIEGSMLNTNAISGQTNLASGLASDDELMVSDSGVLKKMPVSVIDTYLTTTGASSTQTLTNKTFNVEGTGNSISNIDVADLKSGVLDTDISTVAGTDTTIPSAKATKTYVDAQISAIPSGVSLGLVLALS